MLIPSTNAGVVKLVDTVDSKSTESDLVSVRVRPPVLSLRYSLLLLLLFLPPFASLHPDSNAIVGLQLLGGEGWSPWAHRMNDPYLNQLQTEALLRSLESKNVNRTLIELYLPGQRPEVRSSSGRISFLASTGKWFAFGFSTTGSFTRVYNLPPENMTEYYRQLQDGGKGFLYPAGSLYLAELYFNQQRRSMSLSPNFMLSADMWIRPESWYVQPFLRLGISAPIEENTANGLFASSAGLQIALNQERTLALVIEGYADLYQVMWQDYTALHRRATVWDTGWRAGFHVGL